MSSLQEHFIIYCEQQYFEYKHKDDSPQLLKIAEPRTRRHNNKKSETNLFDTFDS